ncbi:DUF3761 domain-containing protein [Amycolatopsis sp. AA4]|nr:DUF3761 domain-containing protein [Amycolatopsis sp. AA4]
MALVAGVLVAGCGAVPTGSAPSGVTSEYSPPHTTSYSAPATPPTSIAVPVTTQPVAPLVAPTTAAKPKPAPKTQTAPRITTPKADVPNQAAPDPGPAECGTDYYRNSSGNCVHRPDSNPSGATAQCNDGTYSYSQHRSGTCSHHGGVKQWL